MKRVPAAEKDKGARVSPCYTSLAKMSIQVE